MVRSFRALLLQASLLQAPLLQGSRPLMLAAAIIPAAAAVSPHPARAADVTPAQAAALEVQVRDALNNLLGTRLPETLVKLTPAGDHYDISAPTSYRTVGGGKPVDVTCTAKQMDDGTWLIEHMTLQSPFQMSVTVPMPSETDPKAPPKMLTSTFVFDLKGQDTHITWDPTFTKPSVATSNLQSLNYHVDGGRLSQDVTVGASTSTTTLRPSGPDRVDVLADATLQDYRIKAATADSPLEMVMKQIKLTTALDGVSRTRAVTIIHALSSLIPGTPATPGVPRPMPRMSPETIKLVLASLQDFASDFMLSESLDGLSITTQGVNVGVQRSNFGITAKSAGGMLDAGMDLGVQGITLPDMPLGDMAALIPTNVMLHPVISGLAVADLMQLATAASEKREPAPEDIMALFSHGGIIGGIDSMTVEVGGAVFTGKGSVTATAPSPDAMTGTAHIEAANLDDLIQKMSAMPAMAQALPVLALAKGLGKVVDNHIVWDLSYKAGKILVNNVDLSTMGGGAPAAPPVIAPPAPTQVLPGAGNRGSARKAPTPDQIPAWGR